MVHVGLSLREDDAWPRSHIFLNVEVAIGHTQIAFQIYRFRPLNIRFLGGENRPLRILRLCFRERILFNFLFSLRSLLWL
jgi:hypothetical protein